MSRPNILWICTDQQRWNTLGCYGNQYVRTPNLDQLAHRGALLEHAYSQSPEGMQGKSFWQLLLGQVDADHHRKDVYSEYYNAMPWLKDPTAQLTMLRTEHHKIVVDHSHSAGELYDLREDPCETKNLWDVSEAQPLKAAMLVRLCNRMAWTVDPLPARQAPW